MKTRIILILCLFLLVTSAVALASENTSVLPGVGTLTFPPEIEILPNQLQTNSIGNTLLVNDNGICRSINIAFMPVPSSDLTREMLKQSTDAIESVFNTSIAQHVQREDYRLVSNSPLNKLAVYNDQLFIKTVKYLFANGAILRLNYYIIDGTDGLVVMITTNADCDNNYWTPILVKIISDIKGGVRN